MKTFSTVMCYFVMLSVCQAQDTTGSFQFYGDAKVVHIGSETGVSGWNGNDINALRLRPGLRYSKGGHSVTGRLALLSSFTDENPLRFTVLPNTDRNGLAFGGITMDEFYYSYKDNKQVLKVGRFQQSFAVLSNAQRSIDRFQSNAVFVHWTDGISYLRDIADNWQAHAVLEYQNRGNISYPYSGPLTFADQEHNANFFLALKNRERDRFNLIQKDFGLFVAPNAFLGPNGFETYASFSGRTAMDLPARELLSGGSFRFAAELGQVLTTDLADGTVALISAGVHNVASMHEFMIEFSNTDRYWLHASMLAPATNEMEVRYRVFLTRDLQMDIRYRVRDPHNDNIPYQYSTFVRATYSF